MLTLFAVLTAGQVAACPLCHTETARQIRGAVFGADMWFNIGVTLVPFVVFPGITALIYGDPKSQTTGPESNNTTVI